jgi:hypothetical protein
VSSLSYEAGSYFPEDGILHSHRRENLKSYTEWLMFPNTFTPIKSYFGLYSVTKWQGTGGSQVKRPRM